MTDSANHILSQLDRRKQVWIALESISRSLVSQQIVPTYNLSILVEQTTYMYVHTWPSRKSLLTVRVLELSYRYFLTSSCNKIENPPNAEMEWGREIEFRISLIWFKNDKKLEYCSACAIMIPVQCDKIICYNLITKPLEYVNRECFTCVLIILCKLLTFRSNFLTVTS